MFSNIYKQGEGYEIRLSLWAHWRILLWCNLVSTILQAYLNIIEDKLLYYIIWIGCPFRMFLTKCTRGGTFPGRWTYLPTDTTSRHYLYPQPEISALSLSQEGLKLCSFSPASLLGNVITKIITTFTRR